MHPNWKLLQTGGHCYVSVADMDVNGKRLAVGVTDDSVVLYAAPYDDEWKFFEEEKAAWPLGSEEDMSAFIEDSKGYFTKEQQKAILKEHQRHLEMLW
ncbi:MAG: hypothetical protein ACPLSY_04960 [Moorellaceae bacterium]